MRVKIIRFEMGHFPSQEQMNLLMNEFEVMLSHLDFTARVLQVTRGRIDIRNVRLNERYLAHHGYNRSSFSGRRSRCLNWNNWVAFNDAVNDVLDKYDVSAVVDNTYGFVVRTFKHRYTEANWRTDHGYENVGSMFNPVARINALRPE